MPDAVHEPSRRTPVYGEYDVVVLGGGPAGIAAAASAGRNGARVLLVERLARMNALGGLNEPHLVMGRTLAQAYDVSAFKCAADALLVENRAELLFHALAVGVQRAANGEIDVLLVETKSGRFAVRGRVFVDCSGDADLAHSAGVPTEKGDADGALLYPTLMFRVGNVDAVRAGEAWSTVASRMDAAEATGEFRFPRRGAILRPQKHPYEWRVNVTQLRNPDGLSLIHI